MKKKIQLQDFDVKNVTLEGTNMIEASAGTGKTYSIAILVLRMILEKEIPLEKIMMVTFTKAAVAELELRIRKFIRMALLVAETGRCGDSTIEALVHNCSSTTAEKEESLKRLVSARRALDQTSIFTIHGFCQKVLQEAAFETGQRFSSEVIDDPSELIMEEVNRFWRNHIATLPVDLLNDVLEAGLSRNMIVATVNKCSGGKKALVNALSLEYSLAAQIREENLEHNDMLVSVRQKIEAELEIANSDWEAYFDAKGAKKRQKTSAQKYIVPKSDCFDDFVSIVGAKQESAYTQVIFADFLPLIETYATLCKGNPIIVDQIALTAAEQVMKQVEQYKGEMGLFTFNDLIHDLHKAVLRKQDNGTAHPMAEELKDLLCGKYQAIFIDEFQDTDQEQYEIFSTMFASNAICFYIGDPKQSIYGFRGADLETYKRAFQNCDHHYTMKTNFRSTPDLIECYNGIYNAVDSPFLDDQIRYEQVSGVQSLDFTYRSEPVAHPVSFIKAKKKDAIYEHMVQEILELLTNKEYRIKGRAVQPSDIGILVRGKDAAKAIKAELIKKRIPVVTIDETKVLQSNEALFWLHTLYAMVEPSIGNLNRFLFSVYIGRTDQELQDMELQDDVVRFRSYRTIWRDNGIYAALNAVYSDYAIKEFVIKNKKGEAERCISNLLQGIELLHTRQTKAKLSDVELINWLANAHSNTIKLDGGDEFVQRLESDENAVQIVTIHSSKGLAYNIVFAPELNLQAKENKVIEFRDTESKEHKFGSGGTEEQKQLALEQQDQENCRLMYVALTRAVYKTYLYNNKWYDSKSTCLTPYLDHLPVLENIEFIDSETEEKRDGSYNKKTKKFNSEEEYKVYQGDRIRVLDRITSFSGLNDSHTTSPHTKVEEGNEYDKFVFDVLPKGSTSGNLLHTLFEEVKFNSFGEEKSEESLKQLEKVFDRAKEKYFHFATDEEDKPLYERYYQLVEQTLRTNIELGESTLRLTQLDEKKKLVEMEFNYRMKSANMYNFAKAAGADKVKDFKSELSGMLVGFIDLVFEHEGKFYILDWKSNYLGNNVESYSKENIEESMQANNYHFQSLIYTMALKRYLEHRLGKDNFDYETQFGGVIYAYLRGCRSGESSGIYFGKPELSKIEAMENCLD